MASVCVCVTKGGDSERKIARERERKREREREREKEREGEIQRETDSRKRERGRLNHSQNRRATQRSVPRAAGEVAPAWEATAMS